MILIKRAGDPVASKNHKEHTEMSHYENVDLGKLAMLALEGAAEALRKSQPNLTREQAFAKVYCDPANRVAMKAEREASRRRIAGIPVARTEPDVMNSLTDEDIKRMVDHERRLNPYLAKGFALDIPAVPGR